MKVQLYQLFHAQRFIVHRVGLELAHIRIDVEEIKDKALRTP